MNLVVRTAEQGVATTVWTSMVVELEGRGGLVLEDCAEARPFVEDMHLRAGVDPGVFDGTSLRCL